jgi:hypothetical protein
MLDEFLAVVIIAAPFAAAWLAGRLAGRLRRRPGGAA